MKNFKFKSAFLCAAVAAIAIAAAPPDGKGGGKGGGNGGGEDPPAEFVPAIAYLEDGRKNKDLKLANRAGDEACLVLRTNQGVQELRGFVYDAANQRLAYSRDDLGIYIASWTDDPCVIGAGTLIRSGPNPEFMDFSPDGSRLAWGEADKDYTGFGSSSFIFIYEFATGTLTQLDLEQWGGTRPEWGVDGEWAAGIVHFSPEFTTSNEIIFSGGPLDGSQGAYNSLFTYNIDELNPPEKLYDGADENLGVFMSASNPGGSGVARIAIESGPIRQIKISDGSEGPTIDGGEPAYSCDNSEIIFKVTPRWNKTDWYIGTVDGTSSELWSSGNVRFFDWFCP